MNKTDVYVHYLQKFAKEIDCEYKEGEIGFGRECVGILKGGNYLGYNLEASYGGGMEKWDDRLDAPKGVNAYHKGNYMAVLIDDETTKEQAIEQLFNWVRNIDFYDLKVVSYYPPIPTVGALMGNPFEPELKIL